MATEKKEEKEEKQDKGKYVACSECGNDFKYHSRKKGICDNCAPKCPFPIEKSKIGQSGQPCGKRIYIENSKYCGKHKSRGEAKESDKKICTQCKIREAKKDRPKCEQCDIRHDLKPWKCAGECGREGYFNARYGKKCRFCRDKCDAPDCNKAVVYFNVKTGPLTRNWCQWCYRKRNKILYKHLYCNRAGCIFPREEGSNECMKHIAQGQNKIHRYAKKIIRTYENKVNYDGKSLTTDEVQFIAATDDERKNIALKIAKEKVEGDCVYCGKPSYEEDLNGIDRIDSSKLYLLDNIQSCCGRCNVGKNNQTEEEWLLQCFNVYRLCSGGYNLEEDHETGMYTELH